MSSSGGGGLSLVKDGDHGVGWMGNEGAENTSNVTGHEGNHELGTLGVFGLWLGEDLTVEGLDDLLEGDELDNGVWNLSAPEWNDSLVETVHTLIGFDLVETLDGIGWESSLRGGLHLNLQLNR